MLKNYLKIAYRNLLKHKAFSFINILGLAAGIAAFVLIFQYVQFELGYDTFQREGKNMYRVQVDRYHEGQLENQNAYTVPALGPTVQAEIIGMAIIALFILCIAWINYINLSTARSVYRAKEVGLRKIIGARRGQLIRQFLLEASIIIGIALVLAITAIQIAAPFFNNLTGISLNFLLANEIKSWAFLAGIFLIGTFFTGFYPAFMLASFHPLTMVKTQFTQRKKGISLPKGLVVFQFAISLILMIGTAVIYRQIQYMREQDLGITTSRILVIEGPTW